jgi:hypothetical protein
MAIKLDKKTLKYAETYLEYKKDIVKFAEECIMIPTPGGSELIVLYEQQKNVLKSFVEDHHLILLKSRQTGFSTLSQIISVWISTFFENSVMGIISRDGAESSDFVRKAQNMIDHLPVWLRPTYRHKSVRSSIFSNGCELTASAVSPHNPSAVFRGKSIVLLIVDEAAFIHHLSQAWTSVSLALSKAQDVAKNKDIPFGTIILSTPNKTEGMGKFFYQAWCQAQEKDSLFKPHKIYWKEIPAFISDPTWYKKQCDILHNDARKIAQELELKFIGSEHTLFSEIVQEKLQEISKRHIAIIPLPHKQEIYKYKELSNDVFYLIGVDTASEAGGSDYSTVEVFEYATMDQVMEFRGKLAVKTFAKYVKLIAMMCPHNTLIIESNSYGNQVIEELLFDDTYEFNIFGTNKKGNDSGFVYGLSTNTKTRPLITDALYHYISESPEMVRSERLALELLGLTDKVRRIEADTGGHDDLALALGFICYVRHYCKDLLGNVEQVDDIGSTEMIDNSLSLISAMNSPDNPLKYQYEQQDHHIFLKTLDKFIKDNLGTGLQGNVDLTTLWKNGR